MCPFKETHVPDGLPRLASAVFSWLDANYKFIYKQGIPLPWLMFPSNQIYDNVENLSNEDQPPAANINQKLDNENEQCTDCKKDLIDILICFLCGGVNECTEYHIEGKTILNSHYSMKEDNHTEGKFSHSYTIPSLMLEQ